MWPLLALAALQSVKGAKDQQRQNAQKGIADSKVDLSDDKMNIPQPSAQSNGWRDAALSMGVQAAGNAASGPATPETPVPDNFNGGTPQPQGFQRYGLKTKTPQTFGGR